MDVNPATSISSRTPASAVVHSQALQLAHRAFWAALFILTPLLFHPTFLLRGWLPQAQVAALPASANLGARSTGLFILIGFGLLLLLLSYSHGMRDLYGIVRSWAPPYLLLLLLIALVLLSTPFSNLSPDFPLLGADNRYDGTLITAGWFVLALLAAGLAHSGVLRAEAVLGFFLAGGLLAAIFVLLQAVGIEPLNLLPGPRVSLTHPEGPFGHGGRTSAYLGMAFMVLLAGPLRAGRVRPWHLALAAVLAAGSAAAGGRAGIVALVVAWLLLGFLTAGRRRRGALGQYLGLTAVLAIVGATALFATPWGREKVDRTLAAFGAGDPALEHRFVLWRAGAEIVADHPLWGVGPSGFAFTVPEYVTERELAELLSEFLGFVPAVGSYEVRGEAVIYRVPGTEDVTFRRVRMSKAHSYPLDFALTHGLPAALVLAIFAALAALRLLRAAGDLPFGVGLALVLFMVFGLGWFASVSLDPAVWGLVGTGLGFASVRPTVGSAGPNG